MADNTLRYIKLDFESHRDAILQRVRSRYPLAWNDFLTNSLGIVLVDLIAWSTATLAYVINRLVGENFVSTMTLRESAVRIGSLVGYKLRNPVPARVFCDAVITTDRPNRTLPVTVARGTVVRTNDGNNLIFEVAKDYSILPGDSYPVAQVVDISTFNSGRETVNTGVSSVAGSPYLDLLDGTVNLKEYAEIGMSVREIVPDGQTTTHTRTYRIVDIVSAPGAVSYNRLVLDTAWEGTSGTVGVAVIDTRVELVQGQTVVDSMVSPGVASPRYSFRLSRTPVVDGSVVVLVNGVPWTQVDALATSDADSTVFELRATPDGDSAVVFGDGVFGAVPPTDATISVTYRIGGGALGNVEAGAIEASVSGVILAANQLVPVAITNFNSAGSGGQDAETLEEARLAIPAFTRTNDRAVTLSDYETLATRYPGVKYARATVRTENSFLEGNVVVVYAWTVGAGGGLVSLDSSLRTGLQEFLQGKCCGTDYVLIADGDATPFPLALQYRARTGSDLSSLSATVLQTVVDTVNSLKPGSPVVFSDLIRTVDSLDGVESVNVASPVTDLRPSTPFEIFTSPSTKNVYTVRLESAGGFSYRAQSPVTPLTPWAFNATLGGEDVLVIPDSDPAYARLLGGGLADYAEGLFSERPATPSAEGSWYFATDDADGTLYKAVSGSWVRQSDPTLVSKSRLNLQTGQIELSVTSSPGSFTLSLIPVQGYDRLRPVNLYIGYSGDTSQTKRQEIRNILRQWVRGLSVGQTLYASEVSSIDQSKANITDVLRSISGVSSVSRVSLGTPSNADVRVFASPNELLTAGDIVINNLQN